MISIIFKLPPLQLSSVNIQTNFLSMLALIIHPSLCFVLEIINCFALTTLFVSSSYLCKACMQAINHKLTFIQSSHVYSFLLEIIHSNIWSLAHIFSNQGSLFYVIFIDHSRKFIWFFPM